MKKTLFLAAIILGCLCSCSPREKADDYPMFWTWLDYRAGMNIDSVFTVMHEIGIDGIMLNAPTPDDYRVAVPIAQQHGIKVFAWLWTLNLEHDRAKILAEHPEWFSVNRLGRSLADTTAYVDYYKFLCPAIPEAREFIKEKVKAYCEVEGLEGIAIDYHRLVDVVLPTTLWSRYGVIQDQEYADWDFGYHPAMIEKFKEHYGYDPREQEDPTHDAKWRQFRCDQVTEVANLIAETVHSYGKKMSASPFPTPKMSSRMVRQDWGRWDLDIVFPMVYHDFYTLDPSFAYDCTVENMRDKNPKSVLYCGLTYGDDIVACMDEAFRGGAQGISIFTVNSIRTPEQKAVFKAYTEKMKALKAANGGKLPAVEIPSAADMDPFAHTGTMRQIEKRMQQLIVGIDAENNKSNNAATAPAVELKPLELGDYEYVGEKDITKYYNVTDAASGTKFEVSFYFYGDVLSGWNVVKID